MRDLIPEPDSQPFWMEIRTRHIFTVAIIVTLVAILIAARDNLGPYIFGFTLAYFLLPIVRLIESRIPDTGRFASARRPVATILAVVITIGAAILLITLLAQPVAEEMQELADAFPDYWAEARDGTQFGEWYGENVPAEVQTWLTEHIGDIGRGLLNGAASVLGYFFSVTGSVVNAVLAFVIVPVFMAYVLMDRRGSAARIRASFPEAWAEDTLQVLRIVDGIMASYTKGVVVSSAVVGAITGLGYWLIGVDLWLSLAAIAFLGEIVPILGPWIAFFISFPVVLITQPDKAILAILVFGVIQMLEGWFISPRIQGKSIDLPSSVVLVALAIGGALGGGLGVILALPAVAIFRALVIYVMRRLDHARPEAASAGLLPNTREGPGTEREQVDPPVST